jgi:hypothetical protein
LRRHAGAFQEWSPNLPDEIAFLDELTRASTKKDRGSRSALDQQLLTPLPQSGDRKGRKFHSSLAASAFRLFQREPSLNNSQRPLKTDLGSVEVHMLPA